MELEETRGGGGKTLARENYFAGDNSGYIVNKYFHNEWHML